MHCTIEPKNNEDHPQQKDEYAIYKHARHYGFELRVFFPEHMTRNFDEFEKRYQDDLKRIKSAMQPKVTKTMREKYSRGGFTQNWGSGEW
jgi:uncharacterized protein YeaO (DUF488 family)